jgi:uncharacterized membrane protein
VVLQTVMRSDNLFITTTLFIIAGVPSSLGAVDRVQAMVAVPPAPTFTIIDYAHSGH